jgi:Ca2+-binding EF-hand superfamily protein
MYFDRNHDGTIDFDEFLVSLRGCLNESRAQAVERAFRAFDTDGSGFVNNIDLR